MSSSDCSGGGENRSPPAQKSRGLRAFCGFVLFDIHNQIVQFC